MVSFESFVLSIFSFVSRLFITFYNVLIFPRKVFRDMVSERVEQYVDPRIFLAVTLITCSIHPLLDDRGQPNLNIDSQPPSFWEEYTSFYKTVSNENILLFDIPIVICCTAFFVVLSRAIRLSSRYQKIYVGLGLYTCSLFILFINIFTVSTQWEVRLDVLAITLIPLLLLSVGISASDVGFTSNLWWKFLSLALVIPLLTLGLMVATFFYVNSTSTSMSKPFTALNVIFLDVHSDELEIQSERIKGTDSLEVFTDFELYNLQSTATFIENHLDIEYNGKTLRMALQDVPNKLVIDGYSIKKVRAYARIHDDIQGAFYAIRANHELLDLNIQYFNLALSSSSIVYQKSYPTTIETLYVWKPGGVVER